MACNDTALQVAHAEIVTLDQSFAVDVASLHAETLPDDVLPALGMQFLEDYFRFIFTDKSQRVIGAIFDGRLVGFCQLSFAPISIQAVVRRSPLAIKAMLMTALRDPKLFCRGIRLAFFRPSRETPDPEIAFIGVRAGFQGKGLGRRIVSFANRLAHEQGARRVTTKTANAQARRMYETTFGASVVATQVLSGCPYWYLCWELTPPAEEPCHA